MPPLVIGRDSITIGGKIIETSKSIGLTPKVEAIPNLMTIERMYPPLRNVSSTNHSITGQAYGNGFYVTSFSSIYGNYQPFKCFNTSDTIGGHWAAGNRYIQPNGTFSASLTDNIVSGYNGDWLKIRFPFAINLTRYAFRQRTGSTGLLSRAPQNFKIYGSNDEINWVELTHETNAVYVSGLYETTITTSGTYNSFGLVVNKLLGNNSAANVLNFDEWFIYGMEKLDPNNYSIVPFHEPINDDYKYIPFVNTGANQTSYNIHFSENTECDILIVGGGGAGGWDNGGGGGAGGLVFIDNFDALGNYSINVGKGGTGLYSQGRGLSGNISKFNNDSIEYIANGGGAGGSGRTTQERDGESGGSGGGSAGENDPDNIGIGNQSVYNNGVYDRGFGTSGGKGGTGGGGGGGGADEVGLTSTNEIGARGGDGKYEANGINFKTIFGLDYSDGYGVFYNGNIYFAGGGGGGNQNSINSTITNGIYSNRGGFGGGARGATNNGSGDGSNGFDALDNSGGGGGGGQFNSLPDGRGGNGGSGIVIIRYKIIKIPFDAQWTYNPSNLNVHHMGNVGIGTINPTSALDVLGSVVVNGGISTNSYIASTKTFKIEHPLNINKWLYHGCIEAPRFDNIYRGKKMLINGSCEVDIDIECNTTGGMTAGTFMALNNNFSLHLQNKNSFDGVKGEIIDGKIMISCENIADEIEVEWLVIGERHDEGIVRNNLTNSEGMLICEHELTF